MHTHTMGLVRGMDAPQHQKLHVGDKQKQRAQAPGGSLRYARHATADGGEA